MWTLIILLTFSGAISGLISYLVFFKGLRLSTEPDLGGLAFGIDSSGIWDRIFKFIRDNWELFAYLLLGIAGALLVPLINVWVGGLKGIDELFSQTFLTSKAGDELALSSWQQLIVFDYGLVFGYGANRLFGGLTNALLSRIGSAAQTYVSTDAPSVRADFALESISLTLGQKVPDRPEKDPMASGPFEKAILRGTSEFSTLVENKNEKIVFKDEEGDGSDRLMISVLKTSLDLLADLVRSEWGGASKLPRY